MDKIADYLYVSRQLNERSAKQAAQFYDIKTVICNRPDSEEEGQPDFETVKQWLETAGVENIVYLPVTADTITDEQLREFQETIAQSPAPILAYCRSGTRSALMWALNQAKRGVEVNSLLRAADLAGIDLTPMREKLQQAYDKR
ncbi:TIGR01244 family sulfur transferase [Conchiformibius steedae DSM 2580]|uniref:TIGR01244 family sulfur transferase n=1 Tax=Conchiformibius steedae DSM 2580 TaxID=1121352 RepID=A0AAE9HT23_9NEIS|nr:TIGR01244 family sulfur transferase [Conchiformibius steedae]QMT32950.1 TIGR01244 family phosphatase [Conchiformibius steedae]URD67572.1 TIGR01244 family sulfur transferase [Conchiformibius steedae DSM 2580]